jgi:hypothetical protein
MTLHASEHELVECYLTHFRRTTPKSKMSFFGTKVIFEWRFHVYVVIKIYLQIATGVLFGVEE